MNVHVSVAAAEPAPVIIPKRHGANLARAKKIGRMVRMLAGPQADPDEAEWRMLGEALMRGDPDMDALVDWMVANGMKQGRALFEQALERGIHNTPDAPQVMQDFFAKYDRVPDWVDFNLIERGAEVSKLCGPASSAVMRDGALMGGYQSPGLNRVLVLTGALEKGASKRLAETAHWLLSVTAPHGLRRHNEGFKTTLRVRLIHALVRRHVGALPDWDPAYDGVPINQMDMAATNLAFSVVFITGMRAIGCMISRDDGQALVHTINYAGWLMGVEEQFLPRNEAQGREMVYKMLLSLVAESDESGKGLARALADEPLGRPYKVLPGLRRWYERERGLSVSLFFLNRAGMANLGLPSRWIPWYPLISMPVNFVTYWWNTRSTESRRNTAARGREQQEAWVRDLNGEVVAHVGRSLEKGHAAAH